MRARGCQTQAESRTHWSARGETSRATGHFRTLPMREAQRSHAPTKRFGRSGGTAAVEKPARRLLTCIEFAHGPDVRQPPLRGSAGQRRLFVNWTKSIGVSKRPCQERAVRSVADPTNRFRFLALLFQKWWHLAHRISPRGVKLPKLLYANARHGASPRQLKSPSSACE